MRLGKNGDNHMTILSNDFWKKKSVFITGHTGFKGSWLSIWLSSLGAQVSGYSLAPNTNPNLYNTFKLDEIVSNNYIADIRNIESLKKAILNFPENQLDLIFNSGNNKQNKKNLEILDNNF